MNATLDGNHPILLVGSIPLSNADEVFTEVTNAIGGYVKRIPDGETGERTRWLRWQRTFFERCDQLELMDPEKDYASDMVSFQLKEGASAEDVKFDNLGYADVAIESYKSFKLLRDRNQINKNIRFQVCLPTPLAVVFAYLAPGCREAIEPAYEKAMVNEIQRMMEAIPVDELAIQWDVAVEFMVLEKVDTPCYFDDRMKGICDRLIRMVDSVPAGIEAALHLCYGDFGHKHFVEPEDAANMVEMSNRVSNGVQRRLDWVHMPVPRDRNDDKFYEPLKQLKLRPETELYLGLIHLTDGEDGTKNRMKTADKFVNKYGIATECGFGRRDPSTVLELLELHRNVA